MEVDEITVLCAVCGDNASGFHYGADCCKACMRFFNRSQKPNVKYTPCKKNMSCPILPSNRKRCMDCHLKKCIAVGMSKDNVRKGPVPKCEKAKMLAADQKAKASSKKDLDAELEDDSHVETTIVRAHEETCEYIKDKVIGLVEKARNQPVYTQCPSQSTCLLFPAPYILDNGASYSKEDFSKMFAPAIKGVVEFAQRIPGFGFLSEDDQHTLIKAGIFEVLLLRLTRMFDNHANSFTCLNGQVLRLHSTSNPSSLLKSVFDFAEGLNTLHLSDREVGLFCAVVIIASDLPGLRNTDLVCKIQQKMKNILEKVVSENHQENPNIFQDLMNKIPNLRLLNTLHSERLVNNLTELCNRRATGAIEGIPDNSVSNQTPYTSIPHNRETAYSLASVHPPRITPEKDPRSTSPGQHSQHGGRNAGSEWSISDFKDEHDPVASPRSIVRGLFVDVKSPVRKSSFSNSRSHANEERRHTEAVPNAVEYHHTLSNRSLDNLGSEHSRSSCDASYFPDTPIKVPVYPKLRRVDSTTESTFSHFRYHGPSTTPAISVFSRQRSSFDEKVKDMDHEHASEKHEAIKDMSVLKRDLQAPPIISGHMLINEDYRHHKKFPAALAQSGIESGKEQGPFKTSTISVFSIPRSSVHEKAKDIDHDHASERHKAIEDISLFKRPIQAPPTISSNVLMDEAYPHHKKFRAAQTDSGVQSGKELRPSTTPTISLCSNSRSSVDEKAKDVDDDHVSERQEAIEDISVLKRPTQSPPIIYPHDEAYRLHKQFWAASTDSGVQSGKEHRPSATPTISVFSNPRSSVDEKAKDVDDDHVSERL